MCGIIGHIGLKCSNEEPNDILDKQITSISHRGPDQAKKYIIDGVGLGHVRLSIIDLEMGIQPMRTADNRFVLVFNGEIYNYLELRKELEHVGVQFSTHSDTEVLLEGYRQFGSRIVDKLNGMFAFAIYDLKERNLFCARDPYGQKPFFYRFMDGGFSFGSESSVFRHIPGFDFRTSRNLIREFLAFEGLYFDLSIFSQIRKLPPGHTLEFSLEAQTIKINRYFVSTPAEGSLTLSDALDAADYAMNEAVKLTCRADVPVSVLLSGGLDSSLVLAYYRKNFPSASISAFHVRNEDLTYDESIFAQKAAQTLGVHLETIDINSEILGELATRVPQLLDEPQADPGILPKYLVCETAARSYKVALTGDGADELFYGYIVLKAQKLAKYYQYCPNWIHSKLIAPAINSIPSSAGYMRLDFLAKQFIRGFPAEESLRGQRWMGSFLPLELETLLGVSPGPSQTQLYLQSRACESAGSKTVGRFAYSLQGGYLPDYVLCNSDRASMLNSLELRTPMLDVKLARLVNSIKDRHKMKGLSTKYLMKRVAERHLPQDLIYRKKVGFTVPIADLLKTKLREEMCDILSEDRIRRQGIFNSNYVSQMIERHLSGAENLYKPLWTLYSLQKWMESRQVTLDE